jgi:heme/copper-type cytochrome/quinol oxidase subunit 2
LAALVKLTRLTTALSAALTVLCAVAVAALQVVAGLRNGIWGPHRLSWVVEQLRGNQQTYKTASVTPRDIEWLLDVPVVAFLAAAILVHLLLYWFLVEFEKRSNRKGGTASTRQVS